MTDIKRITLSSLAAATLLASGAGTALAADYPVTDTADVEATTATSSVDDATAIQRASNPRPVEGTFTWDQSTITSNERISQSSARRWHTSAAPLPIWPRTTLCNGDWRYPVTSRTPLPPP